MPNRFILWSLLSILLVFGLVVGVAGCKKVNTTRLATNELSTDVINQELKIFDSSVKLSQEQVASRIKAEYLKENNGYLDDDIVTLIITLDDECLIDSFNNCYYTQYQSVSDYAKTLKASHQVETITSKQDNLIDRLNNLNLIEKVTNRYTTVLNGIAVEVKYKNLESFNLIDGIKAVNLVETYNKPTSTVEDASKIINAVDVYETGIYNSHTVSYTGEGTAVAILDSGFDCSHSVFSNMPNTELITMSKVEELLPNSQAAKTTKNITVSDVYYNKKIPFTYDYADKDIDVFPYDSEHGTHVAGIIGGLDEVITGVAVNTQLVLMKVFPDLDQGADTDDIVAALEDAVLLNVDAINMSLGSSCGFTREVDEDVITAIYDKINESGISLLCAASNDYSSAYGGAKGNTNKVNNPDSGTVGSPSTYEAALSVASISGVMSHYLVANDEQVFFYNESNSIEGLPNDFYNELYKALGKDTKEDLNLEYVVVPGVGSRVNYSNIDVNGKIALVRRGDITFEEKALYAKNAGAVACIIYNNIEGSILMSMGKTDHIPTVSISKDDGEELAKHLTGTITVKASQIAGPFMSDFSSWGPTADLKIKPEITAHGGTIKSAVPGGGYDELSGTSMATPNLCGIVVLIRQYLKETYPNKSWKEISVLCNQLLMSTATICVNEEGNPYSPRKQGAGLADIYKTVNSNSYITVDGIDRSKIELGDDPTRSGVYTLQFNVVNTSNHAITYNLDLVCMTESVSTSDASFVSETPYILTNNYTVTSTGYSNNQLTVEAGSSVQVTLEQRLTEADKKYIDDHFPYGMYVEGYVKLIPTDTNEIAINAPFLAFYGDWTEAPMFDKTYYEVQSEAYNDAIDDVDKISADYLATIPYGSYFYNYMIPFGTYLYDIDKDKYDPIPATVEHAAMSNSLGTIDGISMIYAGLLRNAKVVTYTITDKVTGEVIYEFIDYNGRKAHPNGGSPIPYYETLRIRGRELNFINNHQYEFKMTSLLDYKDGGVNTNVRNTFSFDFYLDDEAPIIKEVTYDKVYDKTLKKDRYYINMTVYDNQYVMSIAPIIFTSNSTYTFLTDNPIPVYSEQGSDTKVRFEITDLLQDMSFDAIMKTGLAFSIDDYALNSNIFIVQLPGTDGDFKFTKDGEMDGDDLYILTVYEDEVVDITRYLASNDKYMDTRDYLKYFTFSSSDEDVIEVNEGLLYAKALGKATITAKEGLDGDSAYLIVNVKAKTGSDKDNVVDHQSTSKITDLRFSYFDTLFAYSRAAQTSEIGQTGDRKYLNAMNGISFYPGEKIQLHYDFDPWYAENNYEFTYTSSNPSIAQVDQDGVVTALKKGTCRITLSVKGSNVQATVRITVNSEFIIENRQLIAYKGLGGEVVIPDDEGILYISSYAFCLYDTDNTIELTEEDWDANKIPNANTTITKIVIPEGVTEIQNYAFYSLTGLREVVIPDSCKIIRNFAFYNDESLTEISGAKVEVVGIRAFENCTSLTKVTFPHLYAIGSRAFENTNINTIDLTNVRNTGSYAFRNCKNLESVVLNEHTSLSIGMFANSGLKTITIYEKYLVPKYFLANCLDLTSITMVNDCLEIGEAAFCQCENLVEVNFLGKVNYLGEQVFYKDSKLESITLPNNSLTIGRYAFYSCDSLKTINLQENTYFASIEGALFDKATIENINVNNNIYYTLDGNYLVKDNTVIVLAKLAKLDANLTIDAKYTLLDTSSFAGSDIETLNIAGSATVIGPYAFVASSVKTVSLNEAGTTVSKHAFNVCENLETVINLEKVSTIGEYAFANSGLKSALIGEGAVVGEGAFFQSKVETATIGANVQLGLGAFQRSSELATVVFAGDNVHIGRAAFANCSKLSSIDLSKTDEEIEAEAFYKCTKLVTANLTNVKYLGDYAFADCGGLTFVTVPCLITLGEGAFSQYDTNGTSPIFNSITLPETLTSIGDGAFLGCKGITEIVIPNSVKEFGSYMFAYCSNLASVTLSNQIETIGDYSFAGCENLETINLENVKEIKQYGFYQSTKLTNVNLNSIEKVGEGAFARTNLSGAHTLNNLVNVEDYAFQNTLITKFYAPRLETTGEGSFHGCKELTEFTLSENFTKLGLYTFIGCTNLKTFNVKDGFTFKSTAELNDKFFIDHGVLYSYLPNGKVQLEVIPGGMNVKTYEVLEGTVRVNEYAGCENTHIEKIILPDSMQLIGNLAFYGYTNLKTVEFKSYTAPYMEDMYNKNAKITEDMPGYELLHRVYDIFGYELYYYNFVDLAGSFETIEMIIPANANLATYASTTYEAIFGKVEDATRSEYQAMDKNLKTFIELARKIKNIETITMSDEATIKNALTSLNAISQDYTAYNITEDEFTELSEVTKSAKRTLDAIKLRSGGQIVVSLQERLNRLTSTFDVSMMRELYEVRLQVNSLSRQDRQLLDLTVYNQVNQSYNEYTSRINDETIAIQNTINNSIIKTVMVFTSLISVLSILILRRRGNK